MLLVGFLNFLQELNPLHLNRLRVLVCLALRFPFVLALLDLSEGVLPVGYEVLFRLRLELERVRHVSLEAAVDNVLNFIPHSVLHGLEAALLLSQPKLVRD